MTRQTAQGTDRPTEDVGRIISQKVRVTVTASGRRATTAVPVVKGTRVRSPLLRATPIRHSVEVVHVIRHRSLNVNGGQGKGTPAIVPRPRETTEDGDRSGGRHLEIVTRGRQGNHSPLRVNVVEVLVPQVRSPQVLSMLLLIVL